MNHNLPAIAPAIIALVLSATSAAGAEWISPTPHLGSMAADGTLHKSLPIAVVDFCGLPESIYADHKLSGDPSGNSRSQWIIPQLISSMVETQDGRLRLTLPGGRTFHFERRKIGSEFPAANSSSVQVRALEQPDAYEVRLPSGNIYVYRRGSLTTIHSFTGKFFSVENQGCLITKIASGGEQLLAAQYDELGLPISLSTATEVVTFHYTDDYLLDRIQGKSGQIFLHLEYERNLVSKMTDQSRNSQNVKWVHNDGYLSGNPYDTSPVLVAQVDRYTYQRTILTDRIICSRETAGQKKEYLVFSLRTGRFLE